jgi:hypothetical protein
MERLQDSAMEGDCEPEYCSEEVSPCVGEPFSGGRVAVDAS